MRFSFQSALSEGHFLGENKQIMEMKYFRFLFGETKQSLLHYGEIKDTKKNEKYRFLYLRGLKQHVNQDVSGHTLFLCPNRVELAILGRADRESWEALKQVLKTTVIEVLLIHSDGKKKLPTRIEGVEKIIYVQDEYQQEAAGWRFKVIACKENAFTLLHGMIPGTEDEFDDCVMNIKAVEQYMLCSQRQELDAYGCAMGCCLHQDFDVCKYRESEKHPYVAGTIMLADTGEMKEQMHLLKEYENELSSVRFFGLPGTEKDNELIDFLMENNTQNRKYYYICPEVETEDETISSVSRNGFYHVPAMLGDEQALCCSGLFHYKKG